MKHIHPSLYMLIAFILADTVADNLIIQTFQTQTFDVKTGLILVYLIVQIIISPLQAGFSDFYCRKKSLAVSLIFSFISLIFSFLFQLKIFTFFSVFLIIIFLKGFFGNTIPIAWAAVADTQSKELRFSLALATAPYAIGYLLLNVFSNGNSVNIPNIVTLIFYVVVMLICIFLFKDLRDERRLHSTEAINLKKKFKEEIKQIVIDIRDKRINTGLIAYLLWSISIYSVLVLLVDFDNPFHKTASYMMYGYILGVISLKFLKRIADNTIIYLGYWGSVIPFAVYFILFFFLKNTETLLSACYFFHGIGNAFLSPTILSILSKEKPLHEQGKIFGLIDSTDTLGFLIGAIAILVYGIFKLNIFFMIAFSAVTFIVSWIPFSMNVKLRKKGSQI